MSKLNYVDHDPRATVRIIALAAAVSINAAALISLSLPSPPGALLLPVLLQEFSAVIIDPPVVVPPPPLPEPPPLPVRQKPSVRTISYPVPVTAAPIVAEATAPSSPMAEAPALPTAGDIGPLTESVATTSTGNGVMQKLDYESRTPLNYPTASLRTKEQGEVLLRVLVNANGIPEQIEIARSSGYFRLDRAARESVQRWMFRPVMQHGIATPTWGLVPVQFQLDRG